MVCSVEAGRCCFYRRTRSCGSLTGSMVEVVLRWASEVGKGGVLFCVVQAVVRDAVARGMGVGNEGRRAVSVQCRGGCRRRFRRLRVERGATEVSGRFSMPC